MKKFFALVLAVAMVMSMAVASSAIDVSLDSANIAGFADGVIAYDYDADANHMKSVGGFNVKESEMDYDFNGDGDKTDVLGALLTYGDTAYFPLFINGVPVSDYSFVEKLKIKYEFELGEEYVESVSIVKKPVDMIDFQDWDANTGNSALDAVLTPDYMYFIAVKTTSAATTADADVIGTFELSRKSLKKEDVPAFYRADEAADFLAEIDDVEIDFAFNLFYENSWLTGAKRDVMVDGDLVELKWDTDYALKFDNDDEVEFTFGTEENEGTYTVDVSGQGKVYLRYNTKADDAIVAANPGVNMHFVNFNNVKFNRTGEFTYELEDGVAAYKVVDGALVEIPGLDVDDGEFTFKTRVLESYVFADAELVNPVVAAPEVVAPEVTNPTTGA
ncbi:MAG: hypothetical protein IJF25_03375 [Oscillospiraceae bacterium]|nr:hypothetical protein [Oscillospiraceae bacterium]